MEIDFTTSLFYIYRYDSTTGTFTVPPGGDGFYYFSVFLTADGAEFGTFDMELNGELVCTAYSDQTESPGSDSETIACNGVLFTVEGIKFTKCLAGHSVFL